jgi:formate C-acetyltransferase
MTGARDRTGRLLGLLNRVERVAPPDDLALSRPSILDGPDVCNLPIVVRKAQALALLLRTVRVHIYQDELIAGLPFGETPSPRPAADDGTPVRRLTAPGGVAGEGYIAEARYRLAGGWPVEPYSPDLAGPVQGGGSRRSTFPRYATDEELREAARLGLAENSNPGHLQAGHARVMAHGWSGLRALAAERLAALDETAMPGRRRGAFLRAVLVSLDAARDFALRYAECAASLAAAESDPPRRAELAEISRTCARVAVKRPESFREALQLHWFTHLIAMSQGARQLGRFDQYMHPFLAADLENGLLNLDGARELLESVWVKYNLVTATTEDNLQNMILGGLTPEGLDATNQLSYMCLDVTRRLGLVDPKVSVRLHRGSPAEFVGRVAEIIAEGRYQPGLYNDEAIIPALTGAGFSLEHARDYTNDGCSELLSQGRTNPWCFEAKVQVLKCLERTMQDLEAYTCFEDLHRALLDEAGRAVEMAVANANLLQAAVPRISPNPFVSATVEGCLERMLDLTEGGALYNPAAVCASGVADAVDCLAAVRRFVYQERSVTPAELSSVLAADFAGQERLRLMLLNRAPKFGNDNDEVDSLAVGLVKHLAGETALRRNPRGGRYVLGLFSYGDYIAHGLMTGATPDGRRAGAGISPNFSPAPGRDLEGPFAVLQSTSKVPAGLTPNGRAVDIALHPSAVSGPDGPEKLAGLLRAFVAVGEMQVQFNVIDGHVLMDAQRDPERYRNLTVRLWGFPAHFVSLPREFQDHLIARSMRRGV